MTSLHRTLSTPVPQSEAAHPKQVANSAGGFSFQVDDFGRLRRFLVLGTEGGTFYTGERALTLSNMAVVDRCLAADPKRAVTEIVDVSTGGLAPRNSQAIYALAVAASHSDPRARRAAEEALIRVCRTGTHLFEFMRFMGTISPGRGWGRGRRRALADIIYRLGEDRLALQAVKYRRRHGWTWADVLRVSHPKVTESTPARHAVVQAMLGREFNADVAPAVLVGFRDVQAATTESDVARIVRECRLPWEAVPGQWRKSVPVMEALLESMPVGAMTRQIASFARLGMLGPNGDVERHIVSVLADAERIKRARMHPVAFLNAMLVHQSGGQLGDSRGDRYDPNQAVVGALDNAFRLAFPGVQPSGKRFYLGLDVSASMGGCLCVAGGGSLAINARQGSAAMALVTAATEPACYVAGFTSAAGGSARLSRYSSVMTELPIGGNVSLTRAIQLVSGLRFGGTDCALPMLHAAAEKIPVDTFVVYTDNETWAGNVHPHVALQQYRQQMGIDARLVVVGMASNGFTIADPDDAGMMDCVGFSADTPAVIGHFSRREF